MSQRKQEGLKGSLKGIIDSLKRLRAEGRVQGELEGQKLSPYCTLLSKKESQSDRLMGQTFA